MYHSLIIDDMNTYSDFGLIPTSRPVINPPEPNYSYLEVPGRSGVIDLSESLTGSITYTNRTGNIEFLVQKNRNWSDVYSELLTALQGKFVRVVLEDDPLYYYEGRVQISAWKSNKNNSTITLEYDLAPFKYDNKNVTDGYIVSSRTFSSSGAYYSADADSKTLEMIVTCESETNLNIKATIAGVQYDCKAGENILPTLQITGSERIRIYGTGNVAIKYRKGRL